jgi:hypothetical protein
MWIIKCFGICKLPIHTLNADDDDDESLLTFSVANKKSSINELKRRSISRQRERAINNAR